MKKITLLLVIIFTFLFSTTSWGEWSYVSKTLSGGNLYYDKNSVRKSGTYIHFWELQNLLKPTEHGDLSGTKHTQLDCSLFRFKFLKLRTYNKSMGEGDITSDITPKEVWVYFKPESIGGILYKKICEEQQPSLFSTTSWGDGESLNMSLKYQMEIWNYVTKNIDGIKFYYDKDRIRKNGKSLYFWELKDFIKPVDGVLSVTTYIRLDCSIFRFKSLKFQIYKNSMGEGEMITDMSPPEEWNYPKTDSTLEYMYKMICEEHQFLSSKVNGLRNGVLFLRIENGVEGYFNIGNETKDTKYVGEIINGKPNGKGTLIFPDGEFKGVKYQGEFKDGIPIGKGTYTYPKGNDPYVGEWKEGKFVGLLTKTYPDGGKYVGEFKDSEKHGQGTFTYPDGKKYVGEFKDGKKHGQGILTTLNGVKYEGEFKNDSPNGQGIMTFSDGEKYEGEFKDGKLNGIGTSTYPNREQYIGQHKDGKRNGQGTYTRSGEIIFQGEWKDGELNGQGTENSSNGDKYVGEFKDGYWNGRGIFTYNDGRKYVGEYKNDKKWNGTQYDKDGKIISKYVNGKWIEQ